MVIYIPGYKVIPLWAEIKISGGKKYHFYDVKYIKPICSP